jgi:hypothetical protein
MPETNGQRVIWVDQGTFFVLKAVQYDGRPGHEGELYSTTEVTSVEYNVALAPDLFSYAPPPGLRVIDERVTEATTPTATVTEPATTTPQPEATPAPSGLAQIRERVSFPVFVPEFVPEGLTPSDPTGGEDATSLVTIDYLTADGQPGLSVLNGPAGCCLEQAGKDGYAVRPTT